MPIFLGPTKAGNWKRISCISSSPDFASSRIHFSWAKSKRWLKRSALRGRARSARRTARRAGRRRVMGTSSEWVAGQDGQAGPPGRPLPDGEGAGRRRVAGAPLLHVEVVVGPVHEEPRLQVRERPQDGA